MTTTSMPNPSLQVSDIAKPAGPEPTHPCYRYGHAEIGNDHSNLNTLIAIDNPNIRDGLRDALRDAGFDKLAVAATHGHLSQVLSETVFDLIVVMAELVGCSVAPLFSQLRNGRLAHHPFPVIIMLVATGEVEFVRKVINCGPDRIILMPVAPGHVLAQLDALGRARKPFVVTRDYTGPNRRQEPRPGRQQVPLIEVPNPVKARMENMPDDVLQAEISQAAACLNSHKIERYATQIEWVNRAIRAIAGGQGLDQTRLPDSLVHLKKIAEDLPARLLGGTAPRELLQEVAAMADFVLAAGQATSRQNLDKLSRACGDLIGELRQRPQRDDGSPPQSLAAAE